MALSRTRFRSLAWGFNMRTNEKNKKTKITKIYGRRDSGGSQGRRRVVVFPRGPPRRPSLGESHARHVIHESNDLWMRTKGHRTAAVEYRIVTEKMR